MSGQNKTKFSGRIRSAKLKDLDTIDSIEHECFEDDIAWTRDDFADLLARPRSLSMIFSLAALPATATTPETAAGYGIAAIEEDGTGSIFSMAIRKSFRGQGLGGMMLNNLCKNLQKKGVTSIALEVEETNTVAINLYRNFGFVSTGATPDYYGPGRDAILMTLKP